MRTTSRLWEAAGRAAVITAVLVGSTTLAVAGRKFATEVTLVSNGGYGAMGPARASADSNQRIGCLSFGTDGFCYAVDKDGIARSCSFTLAKQAAAVNSIGPNSFISFTVDDKGVCQSLFVSNTSQYAPVVP